MPKHTPGPWSAALREHIGTDSQEMAEITDEVRANARLRAAAPDLLEACKDLVYALERCGGGWEGTLNKGRAAIARVEGEEHD